MFLACVVSKNLHGNHQRSVALIDRRRRRNQNKNPRKSLENVLRKAQENKKCSHHHFDSIVNVSSTLKHLMHVVMVLLVSTIQSEKDEATMYFESRGVYNKAARILNPKIDWERENEQ